MAHIELVDVSKHFSRGKGDLVSGLDAVNLTIEKGEVIGVIGTNGAGKSTLFNCLSGQIKLDEGQIFLGEHEISDLKPMEISRKIGRVFQDPRMGTAPRMTVFENLMLARKRGEKRLFGRSLTDKNYAEMVEFLKPFRLDLEKRLDVPIENLSGGQRQTISLVMATLQEPQLLLLDEHTAALDPKTSEMVLNLTNKIIQEQSLTALMITHNMADALTYGNRTIMLHQGRIILDVSGEEKANMTVSDLLEMFKRESGESITNDAMLLA